MLLPTMAFEVLLEGKQSEGQETLDVLRSPSTESTTNHHEWAEAGPGATGGPDELCSNATCVRRWGKVQAERFRGGFYWVLLSMLVPALIISVLREVCRTSQSASIGKAPGTWIRRLSSSEGSTEEDDTLSQLIEVCAEMQEDLALSVPQRTNPDGPMDAAEQVARIAFDLELEALAFERAMRRTQQQGRASIPSQPRYPASADISCQRTRQAEPVHMPGPQLGSPSNVHLQSGITVSESEPSSLLYTLLAAPTRPLAGASHRLPSVPPPVMRGPAPLDRPPQAALPSSQPERVGQQSFAGTQPPVVASNSAGLLHQAATLLPQDVAHINTRGQPLSQLPSVEHSGSDPDMWLEEGPATESALEAPKQSSHSSHWMSPDPAAHASWQVPEGESNTGAAGLRSPAESTGSARRDSARLQPEAVAEEAPATARALAAARASLQADLDAHPYVRLPGLARGVVVPNILLSRTSFVSTKGQPLRDALFPLRHLFSRLELSQTEVNFLVGHIEELAIASGGRAKQATLMGRPGHGIATLGQQFLVLDAIVSSLQVLGISPHSLSWWGSFVGCFDTSYRFAEPSSRSQERSRVVGDFANRLLDAISTFKRGGRPKSQDIIFLKRFLFFSPHAPARYANPSWDQWRRAECHIFPRRRNDMLLPTMAFEVLLEGKQSEGQETLDVLRSPSTESTTNHHEWAEAGPGATGGPDELCSNATCVRRWGKVQAERFRGGFYWVLLSMLVPALIISVLREVCRTSQSASIGKAPGTWIRRLSSSKGSTEEDDTLSQLIEVCAEMQEDLAPPVPQSTNPDGPMDAAEQVARIAFDLELEALAFERAMRQTQPAGRESMPPLTTYPASPVIPYQHRRPARTFHMPGPQLDSPSNLHLQSGITASDTQPAGLPSDPMAAPTGPLGEDSQPLPSVPPPLGDPTPFDWPPQVALPILQSDSAALQAFAGTQPPVVASNSVGLPHQVATLLPQADAWRASDEEGSTELSSGTYPELDPESWLDALPVIGSLPESSIDSHESSSQGQPPEFSRPACQVYSGTTETWLSGQGFPTASSSVPDEAAAPAAAGAASDEVVATAAPPSTTAAVPRAGLICMHPYVRLPILQEGVVPPPIVLSASNFEAGNGSSVHELLLAFRYLFAKQSLNQSEVTVLVENVQELAVASAARARAAKRLRRPLQGVASIGRQFLVLDAIVSAIHVLGVPALSFMWWEAFAECFDADYRYNEPGIRTKCSGRININLANRMLAAISIYKTGKRPDDGEILFLKQLLFFSPCGPLSFRSLKWEPWRTDHSRFEEQHPAPSRCLPSGRLVAS